MPVSLGVPLGLVMAIAGALLLLRTKNTLAGRVLLVAGIVLMIFTVILVILAATSGM